MYSIPEPRSNLIVQDAFFGFQLLYPSVMNPFSTHHATMKSFNSITRPLCLGTASQSTDFAN